nr:hypothetical protein [Xanthomonas theicola]
MKAQGMCRLGGAIALLCASALAAAAAAAPELDRSGAVRIGQRLAELAPRAAWQRDDDGPIEHMPGCCPRTWR